MGVHYDMYNMLVFSEDESEADLAARRAVHVLE